MKAKILIIATLVFLVSNLFAQQSEERNVGSFDEIRVSQAITVYLSPGNTESLKVEARGIDLDNVLTEVSGSRLKIHLKNGNYNNSSVKVYVTFKELSEITASSASGVFSDGLIKGDDLKISASSAADIEVDVEVSYLEVSASSSGDVEVTGKTNNLDISVSSAGDVDAYDLNAKEVKVRASSAGGAKVNALEKIDARASSGGSIRYKGNPSHSQTDSSSKSSVRKSN